MKQCGKCKEGKDENEFNKDKNRKDGLYPQCKKCRREFRENNKEKIKQKKREGYKNHREEKIQKQKKYNENNKEKVKQKQKEFRENNKEKVKQKEGCNDNEEYIKGKKKEYRNSSLEYNSTSQMRKEIEGYQEVRESKNGNVEVRCTYDGDWFEPTKSQIQARLDAINKKGNVGGESNLYCSNKCKEKCSTYKKIGYEEGYQPATSREVQPTLRKMVFARDDYICQRCGYHKDELNIGIECHHMEGVQQNPIESADMDICVTLCEDCHKKVHKQKGCTYNDLKCTS